MSLSTKGKSESPTSFKALIASINSSLHSCSPGERTIDRYPGYLLIDHYEFPCRRLPEQGDIAHTFVGLAIFPLNVQLPYIHFLRSWFTSVIAIPTNIVVF